MSEPSHRSFTPAGANSSPASGSHKVPPHYACLEVHPSVSQHELARQYRRLSLQLHPDRAAYRNDPSGEASVRSRFQAITAAYHTLSDPQKRSAYDTQHGVNFHSRVSHMRDRIKQSHSNEEVRNTGDGVAGSAAKKWRGEAAHESCEDEEQGDEDDEDYVPEFRHTHGSSFSGDASEAKQLFSLYPREAAGSAMDRRPTILKQVTLCPTAAVDSAEGDGVVSRYGIAVDGNRLVRASVGGVPFPALITIVDGTAVSRDSNVAAFIGRKGRRVARAEARRAVDDGADVDSLWGPIPSPREEDGGEEANGNVVNGAIELTLCFSTISYDLVGDTSLLSHAETVASLTTHAPDSAPHRQDANAAAELPLLLAGASVVSVNGEAVESRGQLMKWLMALASPHTEEGSHHEVPTCEGGPAAPSTTPEPAQPRTAHCRPRAIWLEFATIDGIE